MVSRTRGKDSLLGPFRALDVELDALYIAPFTPSSDSGWWSLFSFIYG